MTAGAETTARLVRGQVAYVDDLAAPGCLEAAFLRSTQARATIAAIDVAAARELPGVVAVYTADDLEGRAAPLFAGGPFPLPAGVVERLDPTNVHTPIHLLAGDRVLYVGQPVAMVVASDRYVAEDALELVEVDYVAEQALVDPMDALADGAPLIHSHAPGNVAVGFTMATGDVDAARRAAAHVVTIGYSSHRHVASPLETRGVLARVDEETGRLVVHSSTQTPHRTRDAIAGSLGVAPDSVQVIAPAVGGGFGQKGIQYAEEALVPMAARHLGRPVRWTEDRSENLVAASHAREQHHAVTLCADADGRILGLLDDIVVNQGAYSVSGLAIPHNTACHLLGPYRIPATRVVVRAAFTNTTFTSPYRGAGRPEAVAALERALDRLALAAGIDRIELRRRNLIRPEEMPYDTGFVYRDGASEIYDTGDYPALLDLAVKLADVEAVADDEPPWSGRHRTGVGVAMYIEGTGLGPFESASARLAGDGRFVVSAGTASQGQRHDVAFAAIAGAALRVDPDRVELREGDSDAVARGVGTIASRSIVTAGNAVHEACERLRTRLVDAAARHQGSDAAGWRLEDGAVAGPGGERVDLVALADLAGQIADGPFEETAVFEPPTVTFSSGAHVAVVDVDLVSGRVEVLRYGVAHDCGRVIDEVGAEGQIRGGVLQGLGGALLEEMAYNEDGQPITTSFLDYLLPTIDDLPDIRISHIESLSSRNPLGVKGLGEGGAIAPPAAVMNAVEHALREFEVVVDRGPMTPNRVRALLRDAAGRG